MAFEQLKRFPEWKQLYDELTRLIGAGQTIFSYSELTQLASIDIRSNRGRAQFYRCRRQLLKDHQLWLENLSGSGYGIIAAKDHPKAAYRRIGAARRRINTAKAINSNLRIEDLTPDQRLLQAATSAVLAEISKTFYSVAHKFKLASQDAMKLNVDLPKLIDSIAKK